MACQFRHKSGLADAGLSRQTHDAAVALLHGCQVAEKKAQLALASDEWW
jgi:hypothetical protein